MQSAKAYRCTAIAIAITGGTTAVLGVIALHFRILGARVSSVGMFGGALLILLAQAPYLRQTLLRGRVRRLSGFRTWLVVIAYSLGLAICLLGLVL